MGQTYDSIPPDTQAWLEQQRIFFVATAPLAAHGHLNCSPKGADTFRVLGPRAIAYLDLTGSGIETVAHLNDNSRIVLMFCAFAGPPRIVRLHGRGEVLETNHRDFAALETCFPPQPGKRAIIRVQVDRIGDSCGYGVPRFDFVAERNTLARWAETKGSDGLAAYRRQKNAQSLDGLPGLQHFG